MAPKQNKAKHSVPSNPPPMRTIATLPTEVSPNIISDHELLLFNLSVGSITLDYLNNKTNKGYALLQIDHLTKKYTHENENTILKNCYQQVLSDQLIPEQHINGMLDSIETLFDYSVQLSEFWLNKLIEYVVLTPETRTTATAERISNIKKAIKKAHLDGIKYLESLAQPSQ